MQKYLSSILLLAVIGSTSEVITFDNNWGKNPLFNVISETPTGIEIVFSIHKMVIEEMNINGTSMKTFGVPGIFLPNEEGAPNLSGTGRYIAIPQGATVQVSIIDSRAQVYHNIEIAPAPNIPFENDDSPLRYVKNMEIYDRDTYYPESPVKLSKTTKIRGVDVIILRCMPFQYNPVTKDLIVYKDIRVRVDFIGGTGHFGEDRLRSRFWEPILQGHLLNYNSLPAIDFYTPERIRSRNGYEYIIIVPDDPDFEAWADTIKAWRKLQGISCEVFTLTEVGGSDSTSIKNFLKNAYNTWNPAPAAFLLLSDYPSSGKAYGITSPSFLHPYEHSFRYVADNWYADYGLDHLPDMHHARICAQSDAQLSIMVNKFLSYERNPYTTANFYNEPLIAAAWQTERWFQLCGEVIRGFFINDLGKNPARQYAIHSGTPTIGCSWSTAPNTATVVNYWNGLGYIPLTNPYNATWWDNGSSSGITSAINSGAFLVQHRDHGNATGWGHPYYTTTHLNNLTNTMFTFVYSSNCLTGRYDWSGQCFTEKFHRIEYGALGVNAASEVSYSFYNDTYVWGMYDGLWPEFMPDYPAYDLAGSSDLRPCMAMTTGKYFLAASNWVSWSGKYLTFGLFHHHGDAFTTLYSEIPQDLTVSHAPVLYAGQTSFTVTADNNSIIALTVNGEIIGVAQGTGSPVSITIPPQMPDTMKVTITKANYYRYAEDISIITSSGPYIGYFKSTINDIGEGNGDGEVNPGETINFPIWVMNYGSQAANNVYGFLSTSDSFADVTQDSSYFGTISAGDSALGNPDYIFVVDSFCPDKHIIEFDLSLHDQVDSTWVSHIQIHVYIASGIEEEAQYTLPVDYYLATTCPNPFKNRAVINYQIPRKGNVSLQIYDVSGRLVRTFMRRKMQAPGYYTEVWNGKDDKGHPVAGGVYFIYLTARSAGKTADYEEIKKAVLLK